MAEEKSLYEQLIAESGVQAPQGEELQERTMTDQIKDPEDKPAEIKTSKLTEDEEDEADTTPADTPAPATTPVADTPPAAGTQPAGEVTPPAEDDISEEKLLAALSKRTGREIKSLADLEAPKAPQTEEEKRTAEEEKRSRSIEFGKQHRLFTQAQYDNYIKVAEKDPTDLVRADFTARMMKEDTTLTAEDADELFDEFYHVHEEPDSLKFKQAQNLIKSQADQLLRKDYGKIMDLPQTYDQFEQNLQKGAAFKSVVDTLFEKNIPQKFEFTIDGETVSYPVDLANTKTAELVAEIKKNYLTTQMMENTTGPDGKVDKDSLLQELTKDLKVAVLEGMVTEIAKSFSEAKLTKARLGRRGALAVNTETNDRAKNVGSMALADQLMKEDGFIPA